MIYSHSYGSSAIVTNPPNYATVPGYHGPVPQPRGTVDATVQSAPTTYEQQQSTTSQPRQEGTNDSEYDSERSSDSNQPDGDRNYDNSADDRTETTVPEPPVERQ
jgi:hypothetical protein